MKEKRYQEIIDLVNTQGVVSFSDLSEQFHVSPVTIRRDLSFLEAQKLIQRVRGGARALEGKKQDFEPSYRDRMAINPEEKRSIAAYAKSLIQPGDSIILDSSSTVRELAILLAEIEYPITVITNDLSCACALTQNPNIELVMVGGRVRISHYSTVGAFAEHIWKQIKVNKLFLGVDSIQYSGFFIHNVEEYSGKRLMLDCADQCFVLADHEKFFSTSLIHFASLDVADCIITTEKVDEKMLSEFPDGTHFVRV